MLLLKIYDFNKYFVYFLLENDNDCECSVSHDICGKPSNRLSEFRIS